MAFPTFSTRNTYGGCLRKWIVPRWSERRVHTLMAGEVETWLRSLPFARASCAKIRSLMSMLLNHGVGHGICDLSKSAPTHRTRVHYLLARASDTALRLMGR